MAIKNSKKEMEKGKYKVDIYKDKRLTKAIFLLALGYNTQEQLEKEGIKKGTWIHRDYGYRKKLGNAKLMSIKRGGHNKHSYFLNWDKVIGRMEDIFGERIRGNEEKIDNACALLEKGLGKDKKSCSGMKWYVKRKQKMKNENVISNASFLKTKYRFVKLRKRIFDNTLLLKELKSILKELKNKKYPHKLRTITKLPQNKNWLICQLRGYFKELLSLKKDLKSFDEEIEKFIEILETTEEIMLEYTPQKEFPYNIEYVEINKFRKIFSEYFYYKPIGLEWIILKKPQLKKEFEKADKENDRFITKENEEQLNKIL